MGTFRPSGRSQDSAPFGDKNKNRHDNASRFPNAIQARSTHSSPDGFCLHTNVRCMNVQTNSGQSLKTLSVGNCPDVPCMSEGNSVLLGDAGSGEKRIAHRNPVLLRRAYQQRSSRFDLAFL